MSALPVGTSIAPWLSVSDGAEAVRFYKKVFGAEVNRRRNDIEDVAPAPSFRTRSINRRSEVTTRIDAVVGSSSTMRTISWSAAFRPLQEANNTWAAPWLPGAMSGGR